jgi:DNA-binding transcriptional MerR regulator
MTDAPRHPPGKGRLSATTGGNMSGGLVKLFYRIGEVAHIVGVAPHVLRYWESEFPTVKPQKSKHGQRVYTQRDVHKLLLIKHLLKEQGLTIAGARKQLRNQKATLFASRTASSEASSKAVEDTQPAEPTAEAPCATAGAGATSRNEGQGDARAGAPLDHGPSDGEGGYLVVSPKSLRQTLLSVRQELADWLSDLRS